MLTNVLLATLGWISGPWQQAAEARSASAAPPLAEAPRVTLDAELADVEGMLDLIRLAAKESDRDGAREMLREAVDALVQLDADPRAAIGLWIELDRLASELGALPEARLAGEGLVAARRKALPADHPELLRSEHNLAITLFALGDVDGAGALFEEVSDAWARSGVGDVPEALRTKIGLAAIRQARGDFQGARNLVEEVLEIQLRRLPQDAPEVLVTKQNLAVAMKVLGDYAGARELEEELLVAQARILPPDHPDLLLTKGNLATSRQTLGDSAGARALNEEVLAARSRALPAGHPLLMIAQQNLAASLFEVGELSGSRRLMEEVLAVRSRAFPPDDPQVLLAKTALAAVKGSQGDVAGAGALEEEVLAAYERLVPADDPERLGLEYNLIGTRLRLNDLPAARELATGLLAGIRRRAERLQTEALRPAREGVRSGLHLLAPVLAVSTATDPSPALELELFETLEGLRAASVTSAAVARALAARPELADAARRLTRLRARINDFVASGPEDAGHADPWRSELLALVEERDRSERDLRQKLSSSTALIAEIEPAAVAAQLPEGSAVVTFLRYGPLVGADALLAFVLRSDGSLSRVELGPAAELENLVLAWREALGQPLGGRGIAAAEAREFDRARFEAAGNRLREWILDPVLARCGTITSLHLVVDDVLHLVAFDALSFGVGLVGERLAISCEVSLARLLQRDGLPEPRGALTVLGGIDYDAAPGALAPGPVAAATPVEDRRVRPGAIGAAFSTLPGTALEAAAIAASYPEALGQVGVLTGSDATKAALGAVGPKTRWLHVATHGWFANESLRSQVDELEDRTARKSFQRAQETLVGFAPETLCGLALAGANHGKDALGRVPGILTAEELATFDLRNCELAVLSACETNVGIRRAGQGIQSLQTALHAAGARTAITSLWKVDDAATRRLFELFYTKLWKERLGKSAALWQAKMALRAEGHPPRDWAGWVLSGDPD